MDCMHTHSPLSLTVCGGIGVITPTDGVAIPITAGADIRHSMPAAGASAGEASTEAGVGDGDITIIITPEAGILAEADIGEVAAGEVVIGEVEMYIPTDAQAVLTIIALAVQMVTVSLELQQLLLVEAAVVVL